MDNVDTLLEKIAAKSKKPRKKKPSGGRKAKDVYAPDMSKGAPGATKTKSSSRKNLTDKASDFKPSTPKAKASNPKPKKEFSGKSARSFKPTLHDKVDKLTNAVAKSNSSKASSSVKPKFTPKKLGLIAGGVAGAGVLAAKVRANRKSQENS
ncbi:hypothetical protein VPHD148_0285 [Vibrio phage D148]